MRLNNFYKVSQIGVIAVVSLLVLSGLSIYLISSVRAQGGIWGGQNLIFNGNFEFGFYQVPELGFEAPDVGNVPNDWNWYKNQAYGKFVIDDNQRFSLVCADDLEPSEAISETLETEEESDSPFGPIPDLPTGPPPNHSLALHMQSTDQNDARLGVYQTVNVVPGQDYRFSMSATIQVQAGARIAKPHDPNHTFELYFDHSGGTDWQAIPHKKWAILPIREQKLYFTAEETEKKGEKAISEIEDYETVVTARTDKMTIFITAWRKWANWRTTIFTVDCVSLVPLNPAGYPGSAAAAAAPPPPPTPFVEVQSAALSESTETQTEPAPDQTQTQTEPVPAETQAEPAPDQTQTETTPAEETTLIIPDSGGVLDNASSSVLIAIVSLIVILGLVGAGIWNMRR